VIENMNPLEELKRRNQKLRNELKAREELEMLGKERKMLLKENKRLVMEKKYFGAIKKGKSIGLATKKISQRIGKGLVGFAKVVDNIDKKAKQENKRMNKKSLRKEKYPFEYL